VSLKVTIRYWRDSRDPSKGAVEKVVEVPRDVVVAMFEEYRRSRNIRRAIAEVCEWVVQHEAEAYARSMCGEDEACFSEFYNLWVERQGVNVERQCENAVKLWLANIAEALNECVRKCNKDRSCMRECLAQR